MTLPVKIKKLLEPLGHRFWSQAQQDKFRPVVELLVGQHEKIKKLEEKIRYLEQPDVFVDKYQGRSSTIDDSIGGDFKYSLEGHCALLLSTFGLESSQVSAFLGRKKMSTEEFLTNAAKGKK